MIERAMRLQKTNERGFKRVFEIDLGKHEDSMGLRGSRRDLRQVASDLNGDVVSKSEQRPKSLGFKAKR